MGVGLLLKALSELESGTAKPVPQTDENTCYASMISKEMCKIDFSKPMEEVYNFIRGMSESPCAYTMLGDKRLKVYFAEKTDIKTSAEAGTAIDGELTIACGDGGAVKLTDLRYEGSKRMGVSDFLRGRKVEKGTKLG